MVNAPLFRDALAILRDDVHRSRLELVPAHVSVHGQSTLLKLVASRCSMAYINVTVSVLPKCQLGSTNAASLSAWSILLRLGRSTFVVFIISMIINVVVIVVVHFRVIVVFFGMAILFILIVIAA